MPVHRCCDGLRRRDFLRLGALASGGLSLAGYLRLAEGGEVQAGRAQAAIFIYLAGGPSHLDTFDPKPDAPDTHRGEFKPIATSVPGVQVCEHLPKLARQADKFAILRGVSHTLGAHELGTKYLITGNRPLPSLEFPGYGAVVSKELSGQADLPSFVAIPNTPQSAGFLNVEYGPLVTNSTPRPDRPVQIRGLAMTGGITLADLDRRQDLLAQFDTAFGDAAEEDALLAGLDRFGQRAYEMMRSPRTRKAFDLTQESTAIKEQFGPDPFAQSCLLATRLVEAGVRFVTVTLGGWDTHQDNFTKLKSDLLPKLDDGLAGLFATLAAKGLLDTTTVFVTGEFGRTPKVNPRAGRDHYPRAMCCLLGGGGLAGGRVVGASDAKGEGPAQEPITPDDVAATFYTTLGIDPTKEYHTPSGRPVMIVRNGKPLRALFA